SSFSFITHDLAFMQFNDATTHRVDDFVIVRGHDNGCAVLVNFVENFHIPPGGSWSGFPLGSFGNRIDGLVDKGRGVCHRLLFTTGQVVQETMGIRFESNSFEDLWKGLVHESAAFAQNLHSKSNIGKHVFIRQEPKILEYNAKVSAQVRDSP